MSDGLNEDEFDSLAAEYVLGTLDADERTRANVLLDVDHGFRTKVQWWERCLGELHLMVEPVEPDGQIIVRIKARLGDVKPSAQPKLLELERLLEAELAGKSATAATAEPDAKPEAASKTAAEVDPIKVDPITVDPISEIERALELVRKQEIEQSEQKSELKPDRELKPEPVRTSAPEMVLRGGPSLSPADARASGQREMSADARGDNVDAKGNRALAEERMVVAERNGRGLRRWRLFAVLMTLVALLLGGLISAWRYVPDRLPPQLRPTAVLNLQQAHGMTQRTSVPPGSEFDE